VELSPIGEAEAISIFASLRINCSSGYCTVSVLFRGATAFVTLISFDPFLELSLESLRVLEPILSFPLEPVLACIEASCSSELNRPKFGADADLSMLAVQFNPVRVAG